MATCQLDFIPRFQETGPLETPPKRVGRERSVEERGTDGEEQKSFSVVFCIDIFSFLFFSFSIIFWPI